MRFLPFASLRRLIPSPAAAWHHLPPPPGYHSGVPSLPGNPAPALRHAPAPPVAEFGFIPDALLLSSPAN
jgi:hypothetical protein